MAWNVSAGPKKKKKAHKLFLWSLEMERKLAFNEHLDPGSSPWVQKISWKMATSVSGES